MTETRAAESNNVKKFLYTLCRHGETGANKDGVIQGQTDIPLSPVGEEQARLLGERLSNDTFTHIYSSDLSRAKTTAETVVKCYVGNAVTIKTDERIRERCFGEFEMLPLADFRSRALPHSLPLYLRSPPTVESIEIFMERTVRFFNDVCTTVAKSATPSVPINTTLIDSDVLIGAAPVANVLVAAHGGVIRMHLMYFESQRYYIPGSTTRATPNTALSTFMVTVDEDGKCLDIACFHLHDNSHIVQQRNK